MSQRNPDWIRDELILALELYLKNPKSPPGKDSRQIQDLSVLLGRLGKQIGVRGGPKYRNANGVYMKLMNFRRLDPDFQSEGKAGLERGNKLEESVWAEFAQQPEKLRAATDAIRSRIAAGSV
jgi:5-methylcytosine-specific restriction enzyme A